MTGTIDSKVNIILEHEDLSPVEKIILALHKEGQRYRTHQRYFDRAVEIASCYLKDEDALIITNYKEGFQDGIKIKKHEEVH